MGYLKVCCGKWTIARAPVHTPMLIVATRQTIEWRKRDNLSMSIIIYSKMKVCASHLFYVVCDSAFTFSLTPTECIQFICECGVNCDLSPFPSSINVSLWIIILTLHYNVFIYTKYWMVCRPSPSRIEIMRASALAENLCVSMFIFTFFYSWILDYRFRCFRKVELHVENMRYVYDPL